MHFYQVCFLVILSNYRPIKNFCHDDWEEDYITIDLGKSVVRPELCLITRYPITVMEILVLLTQH